MRKRTPSFSGRPGFPRGLRVLVLDHEATALAEAEQRLSECSYCPSACCSTSDALALLTSSNSAFDLLLVDVQVLATKCPETSALLAAAKTLPLVLMSSCCSPGDIMIGIRQGAVDFLEKPLHSHRLRNIWQHVVRRLMAGEPSNPCAPTTGGVPGSAGDAEAALCVLPCMDAVVAAATPGGHQAALGDSGGGSVANSGAAGPEDSAGAGESGSNESTSERANVKHEHPLVGGIADAMELDLETSSLLDAVDAALGNPLAGLTSGFSHLLMSEQQRPAAGPASPGAAAAAGDAAAAAAPKLSNGSSTGEVAAATAAPAATARASAGARANNSSGSNGSNSGAVASAAARRMAGGGRCSADVPRGGAGGPAAGGRQERKPRTSAPGNTFSSSGGDSKPAMGYPAGQLPAVPPGTEWGLPTNPIQISPKVNPMAPPVPPMAPWMAGLMPPPGAMMMHPSLMAASGGMMGLPGMLQAAAAAAACSAAAAAAAQQGKGACAPVPAALPAAAGAQMQPPAAPLPVACKAAPAPLPSAAPDLLVALNCSLSSGKPQKPPIGLQLKKSMSLVDLINESLKHAAPSIQVDCN